jgi:hypothetical protein
MSTVETGARAYSRESFAIWLQTPVGVDYSVGVDEFAGNDVVEV